VLRLHFALYLLTAQCRRQYVRVVDGTATFSDHATAERCEEAEAESASSSEDASVSD